MYRKIMVPVDLEHIDALGKALDVAAELSKNFDAPVTYVGITTEQPSSIAKTPQEFGEKLAGFASEQANKYGIIASAKGYSSHDPVVELNHALNAAIDDVGADLVVMASHVPNFADHLHQSHGGNVASHSSASVFVVR